MRKTLVLLINYILTISLAGCGSQRDSGQATENSGKKIRIMIGYENNPGKPIDLAYREWKKLVKERGRGTTGAESYPSSWLGSEDNIIDQTVNGDYAVALADGPSFQDRGVQDPGVLFAPYLFEGWEDLDEVMNSNWFDGRAEELEQSVGLKVLTT